MSPVQPVPKLCLTSPPYSAPQPEAEANFRNKAATTLLTSPLYNPGVSRLGSPQVSVLVKRSSTLISGHDSVNEQDVPGLKRVKASSPYETVEDSSEELAEDVVKPNSITNEPETEVDNEGWPKKTNRSTEAGKYLVSL